MSNEKKWHCPACFLEIAENCHRCPHCTTWLEFFVQVEDISIAVRLIYAALGGGFAYMVAGSYQNKFLAAVIGLACGAFLYWSNATTETKYVRIRQD